MMLRLFTLGFVVYLIVAVVCWLRADAPHVTEEREPVGAIKSLKVVDDQGKTRLTITAKGDTLVIR